MLETCTLLRGLREHAQLILDLDGAQFAMDLGAQQLALIAAAASIDLGHNEAALAAQIPIPVDMETFRHQL